ncbi:Vitamin B12-binding protein precursor [Halobacillus karajensis]|uniref:Vitamin B12-binding protein n=1 Tax=Halobacillus karajensis TaxID=195088 RepID=A0A059NWN5_9BACI|nr:Vitamin B12-binding protein precursor [Halobacillus karajensis]CDQ22946.1 Vitamin B12-binding protein precursor [Halobacillus karajensis]CDQ26429.1 Vitamin B12-binding protein precursor [Halobacillus karajensis]
MVGCICMMIAGCEETISKEHTDNDDVSKSEKLLTIDNYGRELSITQKPTNVLTLGPNTTELFIALGLSDYITGNSLNNHSRGALPEYEDAYEQIPELTYGSATREAVLTSGADFIYGIDWEFGKEGLNIEELKEYGITTYVNKAFTLEEMYQEILDIGKIFEVEDTAEAFVADQKERITNIKEKVSQQDPAKVLVYDSGGEGVFTAGGTNFETLLIELAGGKNIFKDLTDKQWATVSYEEVLSRDPDVILVHDYDQPAIEQKIEDIKNHPVLSQLESVKNERFVSISLESVLPGNRMAYSVETFAQGFHPDVFDE